MSDSVSKRNISFDILKIISMLLVVVVHATSASAGTADVMFPSFDAKYYLTYLIRAFSFVAVNCFVMITGYFMCTSKEISYKKLIRLWITVETYSLGIYLALCFVPFTSTQFSIKEFLFNALPISMSRYWFMTSYFILYLLAPFLNKLINSLDKELYKKLLLICFIVFICVPSINPFGDNVYMHSGFSFCWFVVLYLFAAYVRLYPVKELPYGLLFFAFIAATYASMLVFDIAASHFDLSGTIFNKNPRFNSILVFAASVCLFMFFKNKNVGGGGKTSKAITKISSLTLAVYLIHEHQYMSQIIWNKIVRLADFQNDQLMFCARLLLAIIAIFVICIIVELFRSSLYDFVKKLLLKTKNKTAG